MAMKATFKGKYGNLPNKPLPQVKWEEIKHPRGHGGKFVAKPGGSAPTAGVGATKPAWLHQIKGKTPPKSFKFYKPGYKPKAINDPNAMAAGKKLWEHKQAGHFDSDYEYWLAAQKLASAHNKKHPTNAIKPHAVVNAAFTHEINDTGGLNIGGMAQVKSPSAPVKHEHLKTPGGIKAVSKHAPPGALTKYVKTMKGASGAQLWVDDKGQEWLVKGNKPGSNAYGVKFAVALEEAIAKIQNKAGLRSATSHKTTLEGKEVLAQKMFGNVHEAFKGTPDINKMSDEQKLEMQKQQIFDWVISNWDTHTGNFLEDNEGIIGIDKGQAFKFFGKDKLSWSYVPVTPLGSDALTYSPMWKQYINDPNAQMLDFDNPELKTFAERLKNIPDDEYKKLLTPYAQEAHKLGILAGGSMSVEQFLNKATARKNNVINDFEAFYAKAKAEHDKKASPPLDYFDSEKPPGSFEEPPGLQSFNVGDEVEWYKLGYKYFGPVTKVEIEDGSPTYKVKTQHGTKTLYENPDGSFATVSGATVHAKLFTEEPQPGDTIHEMSSVKMGDWVKLGNARPAEVVGVGSNSISLSGGSLLGATDFDMGFVTAASKPGDKPKTPVSATGTDNAIALFHNGDISFEELQQDVEDGHIGESTITNWKTNGDINMTQYMKLMKAVPIKLKSGAKQAGVGGTLPDKIAPGYSVIKNSDGTYSIQKPGGGLSQNKNNENKTWPTEEDAINSSTMAKYKQQVDQQNAAELSGAASMAANSFGIDPKKLENFPGITEEQALNYLQLKAKIQSGQHTPEDYVEFKSLKGKLQSAKANAANAIKAKGAAQVEEDDGDAVYVAEVQAKPAAKKGGFKEKPKFKLKGGAPPSLDKAKGPNALTLGKQLWEMKKSGKITDDYQMWNEANKLANKDKKAALLKNPKAVVGEDYSSKNAIRNVAMRLEFDETGDVVWETAEEKTSAVEGQTVAQAKAEIKIHDHVPTQSNPHHSPNPSSTVLSVWDTSKPVGSYQNPHSFNGHSSAGVNALRQYGYKYTSHSNWNPQQKQAWYQFTGSHSGNINTYFRVGEDGMTYGGAEAKKLANNMLDAFKASNNKPLDDWTVVTRGTSGGWELGIGSDTVTFEQLKAMEGKKVRNKCPVSSSLSTSAAFSGRPIKITYKLPPGFKGLFVGGKSAHPGENEWILPPGMAYRIKEVKKNGSVTEVLAEVTDVKLPESV